MMCCFPGAGSKRLQSCNAPLEIANDNDIDFIEVTIHLYPLSSYDQLLNLPQINCCNVVRYQVA